MFVLLNERGALFVVDVNPVKRLEAGVRCGYADAADSIPCRISGECVEGLERRAELVRASFFVFCTDEGPGLTPAAAADRVVEKSYMSLI